MSSSRLGREAEARRPSHAEGRMLVRAKSHWSESGMLLRNQKQAEVVGASGAEHKGRERRSRRGCGGQLMVVERRLLTRKNVITFAL